MEIRTVQSISIIINNYYGGIEHWKHMAGSLIFLKTEKPFSVQKLQESLDALLICKKFKTITLDSSGHSGGIDLTFTLEPYLIIRKIKIRGAFPLFKSEILKATSLHTGDVYNEVVLTEQAEYIKGFLQREGYINAVVEIIQEINETEGYVDITIAIDKNKPFTLQKITINGNKAVGDFRLLLRMRTWRRRLIPLQSWRFVEKSIKEDVKKLTKFYWERKIKKFPECSIEYEADIDSMDNTVNLVITIDEGPQYDIRMARKQFDLTITMDGEQPQGFKFVKKEYNKKRLKKGRLKRELVVYKNGNKNDSGLKKSIRNIKKYYQKNGRPKPKITYIDRFIPKRKKTIRKIHIFIDRGPCTKVKSLALRGNTIFDVDKIKKQMITRNGRPFVQDTLDKDILHITTLYRQHGYLFTTVDTSVTINKELEEASIVLTINEKRLTTVSSITCNGLNVIPREKIDKASNLKVGDPYQRSLMKKDANTISTLIAEEGYPYVTVRGELTCNSDSTQVGIVYNITEGKRVYLGNIFYTGNFHTKRYTIRKEINIKSGEPFSLSKMLEAQKDIRDFRIFNSVSYKTIGLKEKEEQVQLFVEVEEKKRYFIETGLGYEGVFWGECIVGDHNFLGYNREISFGVKGDFFGGYRLNLRMLQPRLFGFKTSVITDVYLEQIIVPNVIGVEAFGVSLGFTKKFHKNVSGNIGTKYERRDPFIAPNADPEAVAKISPNERDPRNLIVAYPSLTWDTRNSFVRPQKGIFSTIDCEISHGLDNILDDFMKYQYELRTYLSFLPRTTLAIAGRIGYVHPIGKNTTIPQDQLFFLGGTRDVRGYMEKKLFESGGESSLSGSIEARTELIFNFELATFFDAGRLANTFRIKGLDEFHSSAGFGLRYITPIGPIGLLYGFQLIDSDEVGKLHFSLGYTF
jgi:outer membrane protein insertion porin family